MGIFCSIGIKYGRKSYFLLIIISKSFYKTFYSRMNAAGSEISVHFAHLGTNFMGSYSRDFDCVLNLFGVWHKDLIIGTNPALLIFEIFQAKVSEISIDAVNVHCVPVFYTLVKMNPD